MEGEFPAKAGAMVKEFVLTYQSELMEMWESEQYKKYHFEFYKEKTLKPLRFQYFLIGLYIR